MDVVLGYEPLAEVFQTALDQSQRGKGKQRHSNDKPILQQPICEIGRMVGVGYNVGQAMKKGQESMRLPDDRAQAELLGAMVYLASAYLLIGERMEAEKRAAVEDVNNEAVAAATMAAHKAPSLCDSEVDPWANVDLCRKCHNTDLFCDQGKDKQMVACSDYRS